MRVRDNSTDQCKHLNMQGPAALHTSGRFARFAERALICDPGSVDLDQQPLEIFAFGKIQGHRMIGRPGQPAHNTGLATGIVRRPGDDLLEQFKPDAAGPSPLPSAP